MSRFRRDAVVALTVAACVASTAAVAGAASASVPWPGAPSKVRLAALTHTSFTISARKTAHAHAYRLFASQTIGDVAYVNLSKKRSGRKSATSKKPRLTIKHLHYTTAIYYYRFETVNGPHIKVSPIYQVNLAPSQPTSFALAKGAPGIAVTWNSGDALGFTLVQATNSQLTAGRKVYSIGPRTNEFTPYGLKPGTTYYFRIRAKNGTSKSAFSSNVLSATASAHEQGLTVLTYNLLQSRWDGTHEGGNTVAPWADRKGPAAALVESANPDVIAIQEGQGPMGNGQVQVDTLRSLLGADYTIAETESGDKHRSGNYVIFRNTTYKQVAGEGGHWFVGDNQYPAYQVLENRATQAQFLFVSVHLHEGAQSWNTRHGTEMRSLIRQAQATSARYGNVPIIYAGDFNSYYKLAADKLDAPGVEMRADHISDAINVAQAHSNVAYNSENEYRTTPPKNGGCIDRIAGAAGVSVQSWSELLKLSKGKFAGVIPSDHNPVTARVSFAYP